jgi:hypothetical protein
MKKSSHERRKENNACSNRLKAVLHHRENIICRNNGIRKPAPPIQQQLQERFQDAIE